MSPTAGGVSPTAGGVSPTVGGEDLDAASRPLRRDPLFWLLACLGVLVVTYALWWAARLGDTAVTDRFTGAGAVPGGLLVLVAALRLRRADRLDARTRRAWSIVALALASYGTGALLNSTMSAVPGIGFLAPVVLVLEVGMYPIAWLALSMLPRPGRTVYDTVLFSLDVGILAWSAAMLTWHFVLFPIARDAGADLPTAITAALFPVLDLSLVFAIGALVLRGLRASSQVALSVAGAAVLVVLAGDMVSGIESLQGGYSPGGLSGVLYSIAWFGLALGLYVQWHMKDDDRPIRGLTDYARSTPWLPYLAVAIAFVAPAIRDWNEPDMLRQHVPATGLLIALVVARLAVTARQSASLGAAERERLAAAVEQAAEAMLMTDREGNVTYVNPAFARITGYAPADIVGRDPAFLRENSDPAQMAEMNAALARGESWLGRLAERRRDGSVVELDLAVAPFRDATGAVVGSVEVARDISRERALEARLAQAQRMEAVGRLAGGIAHDFNNILTAISGFSELASAEVGGEGPVAADLQEILKASDRAASLTRALLAYSRRGVMEPQAVDLNELLDGLNPMLGLLMGEDVKLNLERCPEIGMAQTDPAQFEQVVLNLAMNARDAMLGGGRLTISTANADLDAEYARNHVGAIPGPHVALIVADTGVGMAADVKEHAFEPFFTTKARGKGTGLGLSTVIGVVQMSGGSVDIESEPGAGSVFTIYLPRVEGPAHRHETARSGRASMGGHETILIAEDEAAVRVFVERVLTRAGYRVLAAANGQEALAMAKTLPHLDMLFTDMVMPGMGGAELAETLARSRPTLPTLYASGYSNAALPRVTGAGGAAAQAPYIPKPFTAEQLLTKVREVLDSRR